MTPMPQLTIDEQKERVRRRVNAQIDPEKYEYFPETVSSDHYTMDDLLNEYLDQHVRVMATDIESQMAGCEPREQDLILHMVQEMLIFFREKG